MIYVNLGPDLLVKPGTFVSIEAGLTPLGILPAKIIWEPNYCVSCLKHGFVAKENTAITVTVYSAEGCESTDNILVEVEENKVYIPNSFSPDSDGINDIFAPLGDPLILVEDFTIFDRWGELVYRNGGFNLGSPGIGWDGVHRDKAAAVEVYIYVVTLRWPDGNEQLLKGDVMLVR
jgi:gliding motility-associated-like protein